MDQVPALDKTFGAAFIGLIVASVLYGVSLSQVFYYFNNYDKKDGLAIKALVVVTLMSDTVHHMLICHTIYSYLVKGFFKPQQLGELVWSLLVEVIFNGITALLVQSFFAVRIWELSRRNVPITATLALFILGEFASVIVYAAKSIPMNTFAELATLKPLSMAVNGLAVGGDVLITVTICVLLHKAKSSIGSSNTMINLLIVFSVQTGMLTSLCAIASLISISVSPDTFIYISFYFILGRLYCNSLLATLNVRNAIRSRGCSNAGIPLHLTPDPNNPAADNHNVVGQMWSRSRPWATSRRTSEMGDSLASTHPIRTEDRHSSSQRPSPTPSGSLKLSPRLKLNDQEESGLRGYPLSI